LKKKFYQPRGHAMDNKPLLAIVIPVYNEEDNIAALLRDWKAAFDSIEAPYEIILIDDGSRDNSLALLRDLQQTDPTLSIHTQPNGGHGPAILKGYALSLDADWIFQIDGDHQLDTRAFGILWDNREKYDLLIAERKLKNASTPRKWISRTSSLLVHMLFGTLVSDVNSPYRLMRAQLLRTALATVPAGSFAPNVLLTAWFIRKKTRIFTTTADLRKEGHSRKSMMSRHIFRGAWRAAWQTLLFRIKI
jgi:glycosyltransferase involved in cell wall biosynthesis